MLMTKIYFLVWMLKQIILGILVVQNIAYYNGMPALQICMVSLPCDISFDDNACGLCVSIWAAAMTAVASCDVAELSGRQTFSHTVKFS